MTSNGKNSITLVSDTHNHHNADKTILMQDCLLDD